MIREPYNLNPYNSTIDTSKVNNFGFTFSGDELGSWQVEIAKNNSSPEVLYTSNKFVPSDVGYENIYDGDIIEGMALPSVIATNGNSDGLFRRNYTVEGYIYNSNVVKLILNDSIEISSILGGSGTTYYITTSYSLGRTASNVEVEGKNIADETIGTTINNGTYTFTGYTLTVEKNEAIKIGQKVQIEGETFVITKITEVTGSDYYQLTIEQGKEKPIVESPATFIAAGGEKLTALDLYGKSTQATYTDVLSSLSLAGETDRGVKLWKNLLSLREGGTISNNDVTVTLHEDGTVTIVGTPSADTNFNLDFGTYQVNLELENDVTYYTSAYVVSGTVPSIKAYGGYRGDATSQTGYFDLGDYRSVTVPSSGTYYARTWFTAYSGVQYNGVIGFQVTEMLPTSYEPHGKSYGILPTEYTQLESINITDTNCGIDTGINLNGVTDFNLRLRASVTAAVSGEQPLISIWLGAYNYWNLFVRNGGTLDFYSNSHNYAGAVTYGSVRDYIVSMSSGTVTFGEAGATSTATTSTSNPTTVKLMTRGDLNSSTNSKIYEFTAEIAGSEYMHLIPVKRNSDSALGMYDLISGTFLTNAKTGAFVAGDPFISPERPQDIVGVGQYDKMDVFDGDENWVLVNSDQSRYTFRCDLSYQSSGGTSVTNMRTSWILVNASSEYTAGDANHATARLPGNNAWFFYIFMPPTICSTVDALKAMLTENPLTVWYKSANYTATSDVYFVTTFTDSNSNFVKSIGTTTASPHLYEGDTFDFVTGTLTRTMGCETYTTRTGTSWYEYSSYNGFSENKTDMKSGIRQKGWSNIATYISNADHTPNTMWFGVGNTGIYLLEVGDSIGTTNAEFETYLNNNPMTIVYPLATATTSTLPLSDTFFFRSGEYTFSGDGTLTATYSGTAPSPNYPVSIVSVTNPSVSVLGKNLENIADVTGSLSSTTLTNPLPKGTYTISFTASASIGITLNLYNASNTQIFTNTKFGSDRISVTFTLTETATRIYIYNSVSSSTLTNFQVESGSTATDYEPYVAPTTYSLTGTLYALPTTNSALANYTDSNNQMWIADVWDAVSGDITRYCGVINSYASESINEPWLSTMDIYSSGTTPTTGATVVYTLSDTTTQSGTANTIALAEGTNILTYTDDNNLDTSASYTYYRGGANELSYLSFDNSVDFSIYSVTDSNVDYFNTLGEDLIWRLKMYEPDKDNDDNSDIINFIKRGRLLQDVSNRIVSNTYEGETSLTILENSTLQGEPTEVYVQIGQDFYVENKITSGTTTIITGTIAPVSNETDLQNFVTILQGKYLEIDNFLYGITDCTYVTNSYYLTLTLTTTDSAAANALSKKQFYDYTVEFENLETEYTYLPNSYVDKYYYEVPDATFGLKVGSGNINIIRYLYYWVYSDGTIRSFYTLTSPVLGTIRNQIYRLYSNFYISNWYFFQSRETPTLTLQAKTAEDTYSDFPLLNFSNRQIELKGSYSQSDGIGVRYHKWKIESIEESTVETIFESSEIYDSDFNYTYGPLDIENTYTITLTVVNQDGVETSISGDVTTKINLIELEAECTATVNNDEHTVEITWLSGLGAEPDEETPSEDFGNYISVGETGQDISIKTEQLTYSTISGGEIDIPKNSFSLSTGFIINDDAKVGDNENEFYNSTFLKLDSQINPVNFNKNGLEVKINNSNTWFYLLDDVCGQVASTEVAKSNFFLGKNYIWDDTVTWTDGGYQWEETQSDTNCFYYQLIVGDGNAKAARTAFWKGESSDFTCNETRTTIIIPYNPLLYVDASNLKLRFYNENIANTESEEYNIDSYVADNTNLTLTLEQALPYTPQSIVVYRNSEDKGSIIFSIFTDEPAYNKFILGHDTNFFYFTVYNANIYSELNYPTFGEKPTWNSGIATQDTTMIINAKFNGTDLSSRQEEMGTTITAYQVFRRKWEIIGLNGTEFVYSEIYNRLIGTFNLADEELTSAAKFKFIDWGVENRGIYDYVIIPISQDSTAQANIITREKISTDWYGWSFTSIDKFPTGHYEPLERWLFKLNLEGGGYSHQTNKIFHQGFKRYPKVSIGTTNYITTNLSALIGDIDKDLKQLTLYKTRQGYTRDSADKIIEWEDFSNEDNLILIKDYKGRSFIGVIDGNATSFQDVVVEILTQLSFNITQIDGIENYSIFSVEEV